MFGFAGFGFGLRFDISFCLGSGWLIVLVYKEISRASQTDCRFLAIKNTIALGKDELSRSSWTEGRGYFFRAVSKGVLECLLLLSSFSVYPANRLNIYNQL